MNIAVIAPHPDDETLGCGGTLLRHKSIGDRIYWIIATTAGQEYSCEHKVRKYQEIKRVNKYYGFNELFDMQFPVTRIDRILLSSIISSLADILKKIKSEVIYVPFPYDNHSDHRIVFNAVSSCAKCFRITGLKKILAYETISETEFNIKPGLNFNPNVFVNIENFLDEKIKIFKCYESEIGEFPFPRSEENIRALAMFRGAMSGFKAAEAFVLLKEVIL